MKCPHCGNFVEPSDLIEEFASELLVSEDDLMDPTPDFIIESQCDCVHPQNHPEGDHRCEHRGRAENGGLCTACLFGCAE